MKKSFLASIVVIITLFTLNSGSIKAAAPQDLPEPDSAISDNLIFNLGMNVRSDSYVGDIYISPVANQNGYDIFHLVFSPGSYNMWHVHPDAAQTLLILDGEGYYQEEGKPKRLIKRGDIVTTPANVKHWHGATPTSRLVHLSITEKSSKGHVEWKEKVTSEDYSL